MNDTMLDNQNGTGKEKTVKYKVKHNCYWNETLYHADDVVDLPESAKPPVGENGHFVKL